MKSLFGWVSFASAFLLIPLPTGFAQVVLTEVMFDPAGSEYYDEFVELLNVGADTVDLSGWVIGDQDEQDALVDAGFGLKLLPGQYGLVLDPGYFEHSATYDSLIPSAALVLTIDDGAFGKGGFSNSTPETVLLLSPRGDTVAAYRYTLDNPPGISDEKIDVLAGDDPSNWANATTWNGTPGAPNSVSPKPTDLRIHLAGSDTVVSEAAETLPLQILVENVGTSRAADARLLAYVDLDADGSASPSELLLDSLLSDFLPGESRGLEMGWKIPCPGLWLLRTEIVLQGDGNPSDNRDSVLVAAPARPFSVVVNEIYYRPGPGEPEWVELYNRGGEVVNLAGWRLVDASGTAGATIPLSAGTRLVGPNEYAVVAENLDWPPLRDLDLAFVPSSGFPTLNNTGDSIAILDPTGQLVDAVRYRPSWGGENGVSLERLRPDRPSSDPQNWASCVAAGGSTPGTRNSVTPAERDVALLRLSVPVALAGRPCAIAAVVRNCGLAAVPQAGVRIEAKTGFPCDSLPELEHIASLTGLEPLDTAQIRVEWVPQRPGWARLAASLLEQDQVPENDRASAWSYVSPDSGKVVISEIAFDPPTGDPEWVEVYNRSPFPISIDGWLIGDERRLARLDSTGLCIPPSGFGLIAQFRPVEGLPLEVPVWTTLAPWPGFNNDADAVVLRTPTGLPADTVAYRAEWRGHSGLSLSLERIRFDASGTDSSNWAGCESPEGATPGQVNSVSPRDVDLALRRIEPVRKPWPQGRAVLLEVANLGSTPSPEAEVVLRICEDADLSDTLSLSVRLNPIEPEGNWRECIPVPFPRPGRYCVEGQVVCSDDGRAWNDSLQAEIYVSPPPGAVVINELYAMPLPSQSEWVEVVNTTDWALDLRGWQLVDRSGIVGTIETAFSIGSGRFAICSEDRGFADFWPSVDPEQIVVLSPWPTLNDSGDEIRLLDPNGVAVDSARFGSEADLRRGYSLERVEPHLDGFDSASWLICVFPDGATPGAPNSVSGVLSEGSGVIHVEPDPFSPDGDGHEDVLLIRVHLPVRYGRVTLRVFDLLGRAVKALAEDERCGPERVFAWDGRTDAGDPCRPGAYLVALHWTDGNGRVGRMVVPVALVRR